MSVQQAQSVFISMKFPLARQQKESVGIRLIQQHIDESEEMHKDESFFSCMFDECLYD